MLLGSNCQLASALLPACERFANMQSRIYSASLNHRAGVHGGAPAAGPARPGSTGRCPATWVQRPGCPAFNWAGVPRYKTAERQQQGHVRLPGCAGRPGYAWLPDRKSRCAVKVRGGGRTHRRLLAPRHH